jgi:hypothetical protein
MRQTDVLALRNASRAGGASGAMNGFFRGQIADVSHPQNVAVLHVSDYHAGRGLWNEV